MRGFVSCDTVIEKLYHRHNESIAAISQSVDLLRQDVENVKATCDGIPPRLLLKTSIPDYPKI
jgi:hypothetical protein